MPVIQEKDGSVTIIVPDLDDRVMDELKRRAAANGTSAGEEAHAILKSTLMAEGSEGS